MFPPTLVVCFALSGAGQQHQIARTIPAPVLKSNLLVGEWKGSGETFTFYKDGTFAFKGSRYLVTGAGDWHTMDRDHIRIKVGNVSDVFKIDRLTEDHLTVIDLSGSTHRLQRDTPHSQSFKEMREIATALMRYLEKHNETFPERGANLAELLGPYMKDRSLLQGLRYIYKGGPHSAIPEAERHTVPVAVRLGKDAYGTEVPWVIYANGYFAEQTTKRGRSRLQPVSKP